MPTAGGPNTLGESNLVFAYDTGDVKNSYIGEPTTNVATGTLTPYTPYNTMTRSGQDLTITMVGGSALYLTFHNGTDYNGQTITLSGYMFKNGIPHTLPNNRANTYHTVAASKWYFDSVTGYFEIVEVCNASSIWLFHTPSGASGGDVITILDFQVEIKTHATPFVNGARSATQGLLPLAGTGSVDLSNVSFDSSAKMVFDGTNDYISIPSKSFAINQPWSFSLFVKTNTAISSAWKNLIGATGDTECMWMMHPAGFALYQAYYSSQTYIWWSGIDATNMPVGTWNDITITCTPVSSTVTNFTSYLNGIQKNKSDFTWAPINNTQVFTRIGGNGDRYFHGEVPVAKIYNRALTAQEVKQNYQQYKTRFNLS